jgi:hypothetical protein
VSVAALIWTGPRPIHPVTIPVSMIKGEGAYAPHIPNDGIASVGLLPTAPAWRSLWIPTPPTWSLRIPTTPA